MAQLVDSRSERISNPSLNGQEKTSSDVCNDTLSLTKQISLRWSFPKFNGTGPSSRGGHSAVLIDTVLIVFGGQYLGPNGKFVYLNDLHCLNLTTSTWEAFSIPNVSNAPAPRYFHSATILASKSRRPMMLIYGGKGEGNTIHRDMFTFDLAERKWTEVQWTGQTPKARFGHTACCIEGTSKLFIFGGWDGRVSMNDAWIFDTVHLVWDYIEASGPVPSPRQNHSMIALQSSRRLILYGGYTVLGDDLPVYNRDVYTFDIERSTWSRPRLTGEPPVGTFGQTLSHIGDFVVTVGGWYGMVGCALFSGDRQVRGAIKNTKRDEEGTGEFKSEKHASNDLKSHKKRAESALRQKCDNLSALNMSTMRWQRISSHGKAVINRYGHSYTLVGPHLFFFGGWDGTSALNQLVVGEIEIN
uniref:Uncharacterized protein AlNc14C74G5029 n=1 Tax=Albugo laibachii Nc14 TaxID=890382 RepID=F0WEH6_9STRA|nr:conserved hypothetical protein [Albugo laibachii Nc14]|eukprot:CCA19608.1 conserved hypothetical protein [Albugo laibachii Nc14]